MARNRILVVDDEPMVLESVEFILQLDDHILELVGSAAEALARFEPGKYDVILTDNRMPVMSGIALATELKIRQPSQRVILFSGSPPMPPLPCCDLVLLKPFTAADLRAAIVRVMASPVIPGNDMQLR